MLLITQATSALASSTTDINIFPDPFSPAPQHSMPAAKRPRLSLQTSALPSAHYGTAGSNTGNARVADMATATPTTLNTFNNTFDLSIRPSPVSNIASPLIIATTSSAKPTLTTTTTTKPLSSSSSSSSIPRASTKRQTPYELNLPLGVRPILKNSTLPWELRRGSLGSTATAATSSSASPLNNSGATTGRRVFFPEPKRVKFAPAEEEVVTRVYVRRHVDISSSSEDEVEGEEEASSGSGSDDGVGSVPVSLADEDSDGDDDQEKSAAVRLSAKTSENVDEVQRGRSQSRRRASPAGGAVGPRKTRKRRRWEWTLGGNSTEEEELMAAASSRGGRVAAAAAEELGSESDSTTMLSSPQLVTPVSNEEVKGALNVAVHEVIPTPTSEGVE